MRCHSSATTPGPPFLTLRDLPPHVSSYLFLSGALVAKLSLVVEFLLLLGAPPGVKYLFRQNYPLLGALAVVAGLVIVATTIKAAYDELVDAFYRYPLSTTLILLSAVALVYELKRRAVDPQSVPPTHQKLRQPRPTPRISVLALPTSLPAPPTRGLIASFGIALFLFLSPGILLLVRKSEPLTSSPAPYDRVAGQSQLTSTETSQGSQAGDARQTQYDKMMENLNIARMGPIRGTGALAHAADFPPLGLVDLINIRGLDAADFHFCPPGKPIPSGCRNRRAKSGGSQPASRP
jgi:hypothetical protein